MVVWMPAASQWRPARFLVLYCCPSSEPEGCSVPNDDRPSGEHHLQAGATLAGTYQLVRELTRGGMGTVWEARHLRLSAAVAVKVLHGVGEASSEDVRRFRREAEIASQLGHPHIVKVLDFNALPDGAPFLVMELLRGESLRDRLGRGPLDLEQTVDLAGQIASALHAAHRAGVVHRDLKPENIFLCAVPGKDRPHGVLLDFGISKLTSADTALTAKGAVFGTPQYMSPEQANVAETGAATDQYALAAIVYEMLCGQPAFEPGPPLQVLFRVVNSSPAPLETRVHDLAPAVSSVVARGMARDPGARFDDVLGFVRELARAVESSEVRAAVEEHLGDSPTLPSDALRPAVDAGPTLPPDGAALVVMGSNAPTLSPRDPRPAKIDRRASSEAAAAPAGSQQRTETTPATVRPRTWFLLGAAVVLLPLLGWGASALLRGPPAVPETPALPSPPPGFLSGPPGGLPGKPGQGPPGPPPAAVRACDGKAAGSECSFHDNGVQLHGRCWAPPGAPTSACMPTSPPPAPR